MIRNNMKEKCRQKIPYFIGLTLFWIVMLIIANPFDVDTMRLYDTYYERIGGSDETVTKSLEKDVVLVQTFQASRDYLNKIAVLTATYMRENDSRFQVSIQDEDGKLIYDNQIDAKLLQDNAFYSFEFDEQIDSYNKNYTITILGIDGEADGSPTLWTTGVLNKTEKKLLVNGEEQEAALVMNVAYSTKGLKWVWLICWIVLILLSYIFLMVSDNADEHTFLKFSILLGGLFIFLNPFAHVLDETTHFFRSFCISQFDFLDSIVDGKIGAYVSANYGTFVSESKISIASSPNLWMEKFAADKVFYVNPYMSSVIPINHAVAAVGIGITRLLHLNVLCVILAGRIVNYVYYVVLCYFAIKNVKKYKTLFFAVATLPTAQWLAASYSADPVLLANALLFVSICLKYRFSDEKIKVSNKDIILLLYCGASIASVKYCIYTPILLVFFFIPKEYFTKKQYRITFSAAVIVVVGMGLWQLELLRRFPFTEDRNGHVDVAEQVAFIKDNFLFTCRNFTNYFVTSIFGHIQFFYYASILPSVSALMSICCVLSAVIAPDKYIFPNQKDKLKFAVFCAFVVFVVFGLTIVALYVGFTPVGSYSVQGLQTRYWLPIMIFVMMGLSLCNMENRSKNYEKKYVFFIEMAILISLLGSLNQTFNA